MCWEDCARWHLAALAVRLQRPIPQLRSHIACDVDPVTHQAMQGRNVLKPEVMLLNFMGRLSQEGKACLADMAISEEMPSSSLAQAHMDMFNNMLKEPETSFPIEAEALDLQTGTMKHVYSEQQRQRHYSASASGGSTRTQVAPTQTGSRGATCIMAGAGTPCLPFTRRNTQGRRRGLAHASIAPTCAWVAERKARAVCEDLGFHECTGGFPQSTLLHEPLKDTHGVKTVSCSADGWCSPRPRLNSVFYSPQYVWMGAEDHKAEFAELFGGPTDKPNNPAVFYLDDDVATQASLWQSPCHSLVGL